MRFAGTSPSLLVGIIIRVSGFESLLRHRISEQTRHIRLGNRRGGRTSATQSATRTAGLSGTRRCPRHARTRCRPQRTGRATGQSTAARQHDWAGRLSIRAGPSRRTESRRPCYRRFNREAIARGAAVACPVRFGRIGRWFCVLCPPPPVSASGSRSFVPVGYSRPIALRSRGTVGGAAIRSVFVTVPQLRSHVRWCRGRPR